jgi:Ca2+-binding RTX toxin-like protein
MEFTLPKLTENRYDTWDLVNLDYSRWEVVEGVTINVVGMDGIDEADAYGSDIVVNGTVIAKSSTNYAAAGVSFFGTASSVTVGLSGHIDASQALFGIYTENDGGHIANHGLIEAPIGISGRRGMDVENFGTIEGATGIDIDGNSTVINAGTISCSDYGLTAEPGEYGEVVNLKGGVIEGGTAGIVFFGVDGEAAKIFNDGTIKGEKSIIDFDDSLYIENRGKLIGNLLLAGGNDVVDTRNGTIKGDIYGGSGNDTYMISASNVVIVENAGRGDSDFVQSTVTYRLAENIESLQLLGKKNADALGNNGGNTLTGNIGDNILSGRDGADALYGVRGDDKLIGGAGADVFVFGLDYDRDRITDFQDGIDTVWLLGITTQQQLDGLKIRQVGDDLRIDMGNGDRLLIDDLRKQDFTLDDLLAS